MRQNEEKKGHGQMHTRPKKWSGAHRPAGPATTALLTGINICRMYFVHSGLQGESLQVTISKLPQGS